MKDKTPIPATPITLNQHMTMAREARWAKTSSEERSAHAKKMVEAREAKRRAKRIAEITAVIKLDKPAVENGYIGKIEDWNK